MREHKSDILVYNTVTAQRIFPTIATQIPVFVGGIDYKVGDIVLVGLKQYICKTSYTSTATFDSTKFDLLKDTGSDIISGTITGNNLVLTKGDTSTLSIDVTSLLADVRLTSGVYNTTTKALDLTMSNASIISIPVAALLPVTHNNSLTGDGSTTPLSVALSSDVGNALVFGTDGKLLVTIPVSVSPNTQTEVTNGTVVINKYVQPDTLKVELDKKLNTTLLINDNTLATATALNIPSASSVKSYVDGKVTTINNTLTSVSTTEALSASQGKVLQDTKVNKPIGSTQGFIATVDATGNNIQYIAASPTASPNTQTEVTAGTVVANKYVQPDTLKVELDKKLNKNTAIVASTKTKVTYDANGLILSATDATATDIINTPLGNLSSTTVQGGLNELQGDINLINTSLSSLTTTTVTEGTNLYLTEPRVINSKLTGYTSTSGVVSNTDSVLQAIQKINGNVTTNAATAAANDLLALNKAGAETITGAKTFSTQPIGIQGVSISNNPSGTISSTTTQGAIDELALEKQDVLVSGTTIKTVNGISVLGSGDITIPTTSFASIIETEAGTITTKALNPLDGEATYIKKSIINAKGDLIVGTADNLSMVQTVGTNGQILCADSTTTSGVKWTTLPTSGSSIINSVALTYTPSPTGNPSTNYNQFVKGLNGKTYYIDGTGASVLVDSSIAIKANLSPVKDFTTTANLLTLEATANDGDSWIITDGINKGDIALRDVFNSQWIYYSPANNEYTTVTTGINANTSWFYQLSTDSWIQDFTAGTVTLPTQPIAGNLMLTKNSFGNHRNGFSLIQNGDITSWGSDVTNMVTTGDAVAVRAPHKASWSWNNLNTNIVRALQYIPKFVDFARNYYVGIALDHKGKVWFSTTNASAYAGTVMTPSPTYSFIPVPFFVNLNEKVIDIAVANWSNSVMVLTELGNIYSTGVNTQGQLGDGTVAIPTSWVKMILPTGKFAKAFKTVFNMTNHITLIHLTDDSLYGCGANAFSALTTGTTNQSTPILITTNVKDFDTDGNSILVVKNDNTLWGRGNNLYGQLGNNTVVNITGALTQIAGVTDAVKCYMQHDWSTSAMSAYLSITGVVKFAGTNNNGAFGFGTPATNSIVFTSPSFTAQGSIVDVMLTRNTSHLLTSNGDVWNCGIISSRGAGRNTSNAAENTKFLQVSLPSKCLGIRYAGFYTGGGTDQETIMALLETGSIYTWGSSEGNSINANILYSPQCVSTLALDNGIALSGAPINLMTQVSTLTTVSAGSISNTINNSTTTKVTFTVPYSADKAGYLSVIPTITGTFGGSPVVISNIQSVITIPSMTGSMTFTANVALANNVALVVPNTGTLTLNIAFGALSTTVTGIVHTDPMFVILTGANLTAYTNAAAGTMVATELTPTEIANARASLSTYGAANSAMAMTTIIGLGSNTAANTTTPHNTVIPTGKRLYIYGFANSGGVATTIKLYDEALTTGVNLGTVTPLASGVHYFTRKGGFTTTAPSHIAFGGNTGSYYGLVLQSGAFAKYIAGNVTSALTTNYTAGSVLGFQALGI